MGPLSDRFGRRPVMIGGVTVYCIAACGRIAAPSFCDPAAGRAMQVFATAATLVIATLWFSIAMVAAPELPS